MYEDITGDVLKSSDHTHDAGKGFQGENFGIEVHFSSSGLYISIVGCFSS